VCARALGFSWGFAGLHGLQAAHECASTSFTVAATHHSQFIARHPPHTPPPHTQQVRKPQHMKGQWMAQVSNHILTFTYMKAVFNTLL
jgi:hypothetical protein